MIYPNQKAPKLILPTLQHGEFDLSKQAQGTLRCLCFSEDYIAQFA